MKPVTNTEYQTLLVCLGWTINQILIETTFSPHVSLNNHLVKVSLPIFTLSCEANSSFIGKQSQNGHNASQKNLHNFQARGLLYVCGLKSFDKSCLTAQCSLANQTARFHFLYKT